MNVKQLLDFYKVKNKSQLAKKIKCVRSNITYWEQKGIPLKRQALFELQTKGGLKVDPQKLEAL